MNWTIIRCLLVLYALCVLPLTCIGAPWYVKVGSPTSEAAEVLSNLRSKIGSSSKYELTDDSLKANLDVYVACSVLKVGGTPTGTACYETIQYFPLVDRNIPFPVYLGSTSAGGGNAEYIAQVLFTLLVDTTTEESITKVMKYEFEYIRQVALAMQLMNCP
jgi:hypothetical protein